MSSRVLMASTMLLLMCLLPGRNGNGTGMRRFRSVLRHLVFGGGVWGGVIVVLFTQTNRKLMIIVFNSKREKQSFNRSKYVVNNENLFKKQIYGGNRL